MADKINMTADEFFDQWSTWCSMPVSVEQADLLNKVFVGILTTFEERGTPASGCTVYARGNFASPLYQSPDVRKVAA